MVSGIRSGGWMRNCAGFVGFFSLRGSYFLCQVLHHRTAERRRVRGARHDLPPPQGEFFGCLVFVSWGNFVSPLHCV
jgi:hypothetical protein